MSEGRVTISRFTDSNGPDGVHVEFTDSVSHVRFATMTLTLENFALLITGRGEVKAELEVARLDLVGKTAENKVEVIKVEPHYGNSEKFLELRKAVEKLEVDGWKHRSGDMANSHNYKKDGIHIVFFRHV